MRCINTSNANLDAHTKSFIEIVLNSRGTLTAKNNVILLCEGVCACVCTCPKNNGFPCFYSPDPKTFKVRGVNLNFSFTLSNTLAFG